MSSRMACTDGKCLAVGCQLSGGDANPVLDLTSTSESPWTRNGGRCGCMKVCACVRVRVPPAWAADTRPAKRKAAAVGSLGSPCAPG